MPRTHNDVVVEMAMALSIMYNWFWLQMSVCCGERKIEIRAVRKIPLNLCCSVFDFFFHIDKSYVTSTLYCGKQKPKRNISGW